MGHRYEPQAVHVDGCDLDADVRPLYEKGERLYLTLRCSDEPILRVHYGRQDAARLIRALGIGLHEAAQNADLSVEQWDALLKGLDAVWDTAMGKRAEAFRAVYGDSLPSMCLPTDHVADEVTEEVS